jgi:hypothetical protein
LTISIDEVKVGPIYSPYPTTDFQRCPRKWDYSKRWQPRDEGGKTAMLVGTAVALGLEHHYKDSTLTIKECQSKAEANIQVNYQEGSDRSLEGTLELTRRGVKHAMATDLGLKEILGVEKFYGRTKPDLVGRNRDGRLVVVDHKVKMNLDDRYKEKELLKFDTNNQMMHYAWTVAQDMGEPVYEVVIHLIVLAPRVYTELHPIRIDQEHLAFWLQGIAEDWKDMQRGENRPRFSACMDPWPCDFRDGCHTFNGQESAFNVLYDPKDRRF